MGELARAVTDPEPCPYLHDRPARQELSLVLDLEAEEYEEKLRSGYRRFGHVLFRPACEGCRECIPLRVPVERFRPSAGQRRVLRRNRDVWVELGLPELDEEKLALYNAFHAERTERVGWKPQAITPREYRQTFLANAAPTLELRYRIGGRLAAVAYLDQTPEAFNSIYCFRHPEFRGRSLGTFDVLMEIELARRAGRRHLYLGYWIAACRSMAYKAAFRPAEVLEDGEWRELPPPAAAQAGR